MTVLVIYGGQMMDTMDKIEAAVCEEQGICGPNEIYPGKLNRVWSCKTLQNYKMIFSLYDPEEKEMHLFEATYNGDKQELYIDHYIKQENTCVKLVM